MSGTSLHMKSVHDVSMYVMWAVNSNLSLWSNIFTPDIPPTQRQPCGTPLRLLSAKERRAYSPVTPPVPVTAACAWMPWKYSKISATRGTKGL